MYLSVHRGLFRKIRHKKNMPFRNTSPVEVEPSFKYDIAVNDKLFECIIDYILIFSDFIAKSILKS